VGPIENPGRGEEVETLGKGLRCEFSDVLSSRAREDWPRGRRPCGGEHGGRRVLRYGIQTRLRRERNICREAILGGENTLSPIRKINHNNTREGGKGKRKWRRKRSTRLGRPPKAANGKEAGLSQLQHGLPKRRRLWMVE